MDRLREQYKRLRTLLLGIAITCQYFVMRFVVDPGLLGERTALQFFLTLSFVYTSIVILPLYVYEHFAWGWFNRRVNIAGRWYYHLVYKPAEGRKDVIDELPTNGAVHVRQTPFFVRFESGSESYGSTERQQFISWDSTSCDFVGPTRVHMSVELVADAVHYFGVERVSIHQDEKDRPINMHSDFFLYDESNTPLAHGEVFYSRTPTQVTKESDG